MSKGSKQTTQQQQTQTNSSNNTSTSNPDAAYQAQAYANYNQTAQDAANYQPALQQAPVGFNGNQQQAQQAAVNDAINNPGGDVLNSAINTNSAVQGFQPLNVTGNGYTAQNATGQGYAASLVNPNQGYNVTQQSPAAQAAAAQASAQGYQAALASGAQGYDPSLDATAAQLAPGSVNQVNGPNSRQDLSSYLSAVAPQFQSSVIQPTLDAINQQRVIALQGADGQAAQAGAFGGDRQAIYDAETNRQYANQAAQAAANLGLQGFSAATNLLQNDQGLGQQAQLANQATNLSAGTTNANFLQQQGLANQSAQNSARQFGAQAQNTQSLTNAAAQNAAAQYGAEAQNRAALQNAQQQQAAALANAQAQNAVNAANAAAANTGGQFNSQLQANLGLSNQAALNASGQFGANAGNTASLANAAAGNTASAFGANASNNAQLANQQAGLAGAGLNLNAANSAAALANQQRTNAFGNDAVLGAVGDVQQQQAQNAQNVDYANQQLLNTNPLTQDAIRLAALQGVPYGSTTTSSGTGTGTGNSNGTTTTSTPLLPQLIGGAVSLGGAYLSDERLKTNIRPMNGTGSALDKVKKLKGVSYNWRGSGMPDLGLTAQSVERAMPGAVKSIGGAKHYSAPAVIGLLADSVNELNRKVSRKGLLS